MASHSDNQRIGQTVGSKIRAARLAKNFTQSQLAQPDFSVSYVSAIERGQIHPSLRALEIFAQRLGVTTTELLSKETGQALPGVPGINPATAYKQESEIQLLEVHLFLAQEDYPQAITLLRALSADTLKSQQEIRQRYLLGIALYYSDRLQESESILIEALNKAVSQNDYSVNHIRNALGLVNAAMHNYTQGFEYQQGCLDQLKKEQQPHDMFFDAQVYTDMGLHYEGVDKIDNAIEMFQQSLAQTNGLGALKPLTTMYWNMSRYFAEAQQYFLSTLYGYKTLHILIQAYDDSLRSEIYHNLGQAALHGDLQKAVIDLESLLQDATLEKDVLAIASITATIAEVLLRQGEVENAYEYAQKACELTSEYEECVVTASIILTCGNISYAQKNYEIGDEQFLTGLSMFERLDNREELADKYAIYAQLLEGRGLEAEALKFYKKAYEVNREHE